MNRHDRKVALKLRECPNCGGDCSTAFCAVCWGLIPAPVKHTIRAQFQIGAPRLAVRSGVEALQKLAAAGVPMPVPKSRKGRGASCPSFSQVRTQRRAA